MSADDGSVLVTQALLDAMRERAERAEADVERLRDALEEIANGLACIERDDHRGDLLDAIRFARADARKALAETEPKC